MEMENGETGFSRINRLFAGHRGDVSTGTELSILGRWTEY